MYALFWPGESKLELSLVLKIQKFQSLGVVDEVVLSNAFNMASSSESSEAEDLEKFAVITDIVNSGEISWEQNNFLSVNLLFV